MTASRKRRRSRSAPPLPEPSEHQMFEAMIAFNHLKTRYQLQELPNAPPTMRFIVKVIPEMMVGDVEFMGAKGLPGVHHGAPPSDLAYTIHRFASEQDARRFRETEIIRETVKVAMRTRP